MFDKLQLKYFLLRFVILYLHCAVSVSSTEIIQTYCHIAEINGSIWTGVNATCRCKDECGGSGNFNYSTLIVSTPPDLLLLIRSVQKYNRTEIETFPKWLIINFENYKLFGDSCSCGDFGDRTSIGKIVSLELFNYYVHDFASVFYPSLSKFYTLKDLFASLNNLLFPFLFTLAVFNIFVVYRMLTKSSVSFTIQMLQYIASALGNLLNSDLVYFTVTYKNNFYPMLWYQYFQMSFTIWALMLSTVLITDRLLCIWKPIFYKNNVTPVKALILCGVLYLLCFLIGVCYKYISWASEPGCYIWNGFWFAILILSQIVMLIIFVIVMKVKSRESASTLSSHQMSIIKLVTLCVFIEMSVSFVFLLEKVVLLIPLIPPVVSDPVLKKYYQTLQPPITAWKKSLMTISPFVSLIISVTFSKMYRRAFFSAFPCLRFLRCKKCHKNSVNPSSTTNFTGMTGASTTTRRSTMLASSLPTVN